MARTRYEFKTLTDPSSENDHFWITDATEYLRRIANQASFARGTVAGRRA